MAVPNANVPFERPIAAATSEHEKKDETGSCQPEPDLVRRTCPQYEQPDDGRHDDVDDRGQDQRDGVGRWTLRHLGQHGVAQNQQDRAAMVSRSSRMKS